MARKKHLISKPKLSARRAFLLFLPLAVIAATVVFSILKGSVSGCNCTDFSGEFNPQERVASFEGKKIDIPQEVLVSLGKTEEPQVLGTVSGGERWIEIDLSEQKIRAWEGDQLFLESAVSTGLPWSPTPKGEYNIWIKLRATKMEGGQGKHYYYLPNVPYVMYFYKGYGLHGTYWHNDFGTQRSHGCVNLPTPIAEKLFYWVSPVLEDGKGVVRASGENPGTRIVIHD